MNVADIEGRPIVTGLLRIDTGDGAPPSRGPCDRKLDWKLIALVAGLCGLVIGRLFIPDQGSGYAKSAH